MYANNLIIKSKVIRDNPYYVNTNIKNLIIYKCPLFKYAMKENNNVYETYLQEIKNINNAGYLTKYRFYSIFIELDVISFKD
jgi:hypothetical protein